MGVFNSLNDTNEKALEVGERYLDTTVNYYRLKLFKHLTISVSLVFKGVVIGGIALIGLLLLSFAFAIMLGETIESYALGFIIMGTIYSVIALISYFLKDRITTKVLKKMSKNFSVNP